MQIIEYAKNQGESQNEGIKFADTAEWLFAKVENIIKLMHFSKTIKDPIKPYKEAKQS